ncbi:type II secretion system protein N [Candidatus Ichthyocystis sparus]|uniref:type II secretion system protein N n=1 Tax=Candidatus Ichthyocystis sparus TaxID=1561004 RepID=UPI000B856FAB|nr:type II secretion system protein N [Candidatus Ichthyocystis sparus]
MKKILLFLFFVIGMFCFVPSSVINMVFKHFNVPLLLENGYGTIWSGGGGMFFSPPPKSTLKPFIILDQVNWKVDFSHIFSKGLVIVFKSNNFLKDIFLSVSLNKISLSRLKIFSNAEILEKLGEPLHTLALHGVVTFESNGVTFGSDSVVGEAVAHFDLISSRLVPGVNVLGSYDLRIGFINNRSLVDLSSRDDVVILKGSGKIDWSSRHFVFKGFAEASPQAPISVQKILLLVGRRSHGSRSILDINFSW